MINYILGHGLEFREYVQSYTNASFLLSDRYQDTEDLDGLFSGYDPVTASYDPSSWAYDSIAAEERQRRPGQGAVRALPARRRAARSSKALPARSPPTPRWKIRAACSRCSSGTSPATPRRWSSGCAGCRSRRSCRYAGPGPDLRPGAHRRAGLQRRLDPAHRGPAVHPGRLDHPAAAGQHRPPGRRHLRAARPRQHPGIDRHPDPVQPAARLPADGRHHAQRPAPLPGHRGRRPAEGLLAQRRHVLHLAAQGVLGRRRDRGQRLLLRLPAPDQRGPRHLPHRDGHGRREGVRVLPARPEPGGRVGARPAAAARPGQTGLAGGARPDHDRERHVLAGRPGDRDRRDRARGSARPRCSSCPPPPTPRRSGTFTQTQRMLQWRDQAVDPAGDQRSDLWFAYHLGRRLGQKLAGWPTTGTGPCSTWPGTTAPTGTSRPPRTCSAGSAA